MESIPLRAHLVWFGAKFPWLNVLAVRSAALRGGFDEVVLHHDTDLQTTPYYRQLCETPRVRLRRIDVAGILANCAPYTTHLAQVFERLRTPATRSDLIRWALLFGEGGVYLDSDTVTVGALAPLCASANAFCGLERIVFPAHVRNSRDVRVRGPALLRSLLRSTLRIAPRGWAGFQTLEECFCVAANTAVLGAAARSPFVMEALERMMSLSPKEQPKPNVIGPHLLQATLAAYRGSDVQVHPPAVFYPLAPEISQHWFRRESPRHLERIVTKATRVVHWYGSVRTAHLVDRIDPEYVRAHAERQLFSALALPFV